VLTPGPTADTVPAAGRARSSDVNDLSDATEALGEVLRLCFYESRLRRLTADCFAATQLRGGSWSG